MGAPYYCACACACFYRIAASEAQKRKKGDCCSYRQTLELSRPVIFSSHTETRVECSDARTDQAREKALASVNRSGLPIPEKERPCTAPKESLA